MQDAAEMDEIRLPTNPIDSAAWRRSENARPSRCEHVQLLCECTGINWAHEHEPRREGHHDTDRTNVTAPFSNGRRN
jgi:hypothetical protein